ncbi:MAG: hypothetical protein QOJ42_3415 [Acidobacteriaceae bacterium]|jgi:hypothetical protein|nr:hypothetical protein [Acidobacteriaceae bacterium]
MTDSQLILTNGARSCCPHRNSVERLVHRLRRTCRRTPAVPLYLSFGTYPSSQTSSIAANN